MQRFDEKKTKGIIGTYTWANPIMQDSGGFTRTSVPWEAVLHDCPILILEHQDSLRTKVSISQNLDRNRAYPSGNTTIIIFSLHWRIFERCLKLAQIRVIHKFSLEFSTFLFFKKVLKYRMIANCNTNTKVQEMLHAKY